MSKPPCIDGTMAHRIRVAEADGPLVPGRCQRCGWERSYRPGVCEAITDISIKHGGRRDLQETEAEMRKRVADRARRAGIATKASVARARAARGAA